MHVYPFRIQVLASGKLEQRLEHSPALLGRSRWPGYTKAVAATGNLDVETTFDLTQVFIKLSTQVGQTIIVGGLENDVPGDLLSIQGRFRLPLSGHRGK